MENINQMSPEEVREILDREDIDPALCHEVEPEDENQFDLYRELNSLFAESGYLHSAGSGDVLGCREGSQSVQPL